MDNFIIFDIDIDFVNEAKRLSKYGINVIHSSAENLINNIKVDAIVSPANSFGWMNGGIDKVYSQMFNNIQNEVQNNIKKFNFKYDTDKWYLPIGSAITVKTNNSKCPLLICNPTMFFPGNITNTNNVFYCFVSLIYLAKMNTNLVIACPGLGTGVGMLSSKYAVDQIEKAILGYPNIVKSDNYKNQVKYMDKFNIVLHSRN